MTTPSPDLVAFLRAQYDREEKLALEVPESRRNWHTSGGWPETGPDAVADGRGYVAEEIEACDAYLIATWDPARVLAEVESRRRTLGRCEEITGGDMELATAVSPEDWLAKMILTDMAQPYSDKPGFQESWRA